MSRMALAAWIYMYTSGCPISTTMPCTLYASQCPLGVEISTGYYPQMYPYPNNFELTFSSLAQGNCQRYSHQEVPHCPHVVLSDGKPTSPLHIYLARCLSIHVRSPNHETV